MKKRLVSVLGTLALAITACTATTPQASSAPAPVAPDAASRPAAELSAVRSTTPLAAVGAEPAHPTEAPARPVPPVAPKVEPKATPKPAPKAADPKPAAERTAKAAPTVKQARAYALRQIGSSQYRCLNLLWTKESNWNPRAMNPSSGAYGIPQSLPGRKMATHGADWRTNPMTQVRWGLSYIEGRYGTACAAWRHSQQHNWY